MITAKEAKKAADGSEKIQRLLQHQMKELNRRISKNATQGNYQFEIKLPAETSLGRGTRAEVLKRVVIKLQNLGFVVADTNRGKYLISWN